MTTIDWSSRAQKSELCIKNFIDGSCTEILSNDIVKKYSPRDGSLLYQFNSSPQSEVEKAVSAARATFDDRRWCYFPVQKRKKILLRIADLLDIHQEKLALYDCLDVGKPITQALGEASRAAEIFRESAEGVVRLLSSSAADGATFAHQVHKPLGVVGAIIGWNFPLVLAALKVAPALAIGNSVVLKPSEFSSLSARYLAAIAVEAGVPEGVFNVVHGKGKSVGAYLAHHPEINLLSFTGSSATGKQMLLASGNSNMKRLLLECGGKSPYIVFNDCPKDLDFIAAGIVDNAFRNQGEFCIAGTRLLIQETIKSKLLPRVIEQAAQLIPEDPLDPNTLFGALINEAHLNKVLNYIDTGQKEGAHLILGGERLKVNVGNANGQGYYLGPTVFDNVDPNKTIAQEEIFGPILSVISFKDEQEAIRIANNTSYGLAAYAATENLGRAHRLIQQLNAGLIMITGSSKPTGGYVELGREGHRESGFGHEGGQLGLKAYTASSMAHIFT